VATVDLVRRAERIGKATLAAYEPPPLDLAIAEEFDAFVARRRSSLDARRRAGSGRTISRRRSARAV
jgi:trimethylamine:corrinoid methyltransferase-like protein